MRPRRKTRARRKDNMKVGKARELKNDMRRRRARRRRPRRRMRRHKTKARKPTSVPTVKRIIATHITV